MTPATEMTALEFINNQNITVCTEAIEALEAFDGTMEEYIDTHERGVKAFFWLLRENHNAISPLITPEKTEMYIKKAPSIALEYATLWLTPEHLDWCAVQSPMSALKYAAPWLTPERLDWCAAQNSMYAITYAAPWLTPERLDWCAIDNPRQAIVCASRLLTPERLDWCKTQCA